MSAKTSDILFSIALICAGIGVAIYNIISYMKALKYDRAERLNRVGEYKRDRITKLMRDFLNKKFEDACILINVYRESFSLYSYETYLHIVKYRDDLFIHFMYECPYRYESEFINTWIKMEFNSNFQELIIHPLWELRYKNAARESLENQLKECIEAEDYETCSKIKAQLDLI